MNNIQLSDEQNEFITEALKGTNILVDACIGSGKTTSIQQLCLKYPRDKKILYLTYNRLLKVDAKEKIKLKNVHVQNYDGFAFWMLMRSGHSMPNRSNIMEVFNNVRPTLDHYDVLIIDEYQDIKKDHSILLEYIKESNPGIQIIAVGDMAQKIYDMTTLNVYSFINSFLDIHIKMEFTQCFRLSNNLASTLGRIWNKRIVGVNNSCKVSIMNSYDVIDFIAQQNIKDILCLGSRFGQMTKVLNSLEEDYSNKFNKKTVYASIRDGDVLPTNKCAIFTTFDASKGLERDICVIFDFSETYWNLRVNQNQTKYEIIRNIFCVAASRGKKQIIFVKNKNDDLLSEEVLSTDTTVNHSFNDVNISEMFDFKYSEDIEECYNSLNISKVREISDNIDITNHDGLIDLSPCIGTYQEAMYFNNYKIENQIELLKITNKDRFLYIDKKWSLEEKILAITAFETHQNRYIHQVKIPYITDAQKIAITNRLQNLFSKNEIVQKKCKIDILDNSNNKLFSAIGRCDVIKNNSVYELKFTSALAHEHFLQCACYMIALNLKIGYLWNVKTNEMYKIEIPNRDNFVKLITKTITKRAF